MTVETNWGGNIRYTAGKIYAPQTIPEAQRCVKQSRKIRAVGARHSFSNVVDAPELLDLRALPFTLEIDRERRRATVSGGAPYGRVAQALHDTGWALHNLGSLPDITVAGACATGTHGSGTSNPVLADAVVGADIIRADGDIESLDDSSPEFGGEILALGSAGIITKLVLDIQPTYHVLQAPRRGLAWSTFLAEAPVIMASAYSVSVFGRWSASELDLLWRKTRDDSELPDADSWGTQSLAGDDPIRLQARAGVLSPIDLPLPWYQTLPHRSFGQTVGAGGEIQSEYFVDLADAADALAAVRELASVIDPLLLATEFRTVAADLMWMSPAYGRRSFCIHFTWRPLPTEVTAALRLIETALGPFSARTHWGKLFHDASWTLRTLPEASRWFELVQSRDPQGKFSGPFLDQLRMAAPPHDGLDR